MRSREGLLGQTLAERIDDPFRSAVAQLLGVEVVAGHTHAGDAGGMGGVRVMGGVTDDDAEQAAAILDEVHVHA